MWDTGDWLVQSFISNKRKPIPEADNNSYNIVISISLLYSVRGECNADSGMIKLVLSSALKGGMSLSDSELIKRITYFFYVTAGNYQNTGHGIYSVHL